MHDSRNEKERNEASPELPYGQKSVRGEGPRMTLGTRRSSIMNVALCASRLHGSAPRDRIRAFSKYNRRHGPLEAT